MYRFSSVKFSSVTQSYPTLCDPMNRSTPGLPVHHQLLEFTQTHVHWVIDAIQPSHPLSSPSPPAPNPSQHQSLFQCRKVRSESEVAQLCLTLSDPMECSPLGSSVHGIFQARVLEWGAIAFSDKQGQMELPMLRRKDNFSSALLGSWLRPPMIKERLSGEKQT